MKYIITEAQVNKFKEDRWCKYIEDIVLSMGLKNLCGVQVRVIDYESGDGEIIKNYLVILQSDYHNRDMENVVSQNINDYLPHLELIVIRLDCDTPVNIKESTTRKVLKEETEGIRPFLYKIMSTYPETEIYIDEIKSFIENSNCKKIEVSKFKFPAFGLALHNGVLFNESIFNYPLSSFLFVMAHEIAHQYQYKKYGDDKMYECYLGEVSVEDAAKAMKEVEIIADEFATRKLREFIKIGLIDKDDDRKINAMYSSVPLRHFENLISKTRDDLKQKNLKSFEGITNYFYNMIKVNT
jgi:hypothetical protein